MEDGQGITRWVRPMRRRVARRRSPSLLRRKCVCLDERSRDGVLVAGAFTRQSDRGVLSGKKNVKVASPGRLFAFSASSPCRGLVAWSPCQPRRKVKVALSSSSPGRLIWPTGVLSDPPSCQLASIIALCCGFESRRTGSSKTARGGEVRDRFSPSAHLPSLAEGPNKGHGHHFFWVCACVSVGPSSSRIV